MPALRGTKRKANGTAAKTNDDTTTTESIDRDAWPGWVEMESEPAIFNVMLKEMGVRGVKVQELYSVEDDLLAILPQPVHALIFLFKYRAQDEKTNGATSCPDEVWFANQIPDFACASVALINIVNNIPGLTLGNELQEFREFTASMDPMSRGDAIDSFDFVRRLHNSFATDTDIMNADLHLRSRMLRLKRRRAALKANETKAAKKATLTPLKERSANEISPRVSRAPARTSKRSGNDPDNDGDDDYGSKSALSVIVDETPVRRSARQPKLRTALNGRPHGGDDDEEEESGHHFIAYMPIHGHVWRMDGLDYFPQDMGPYTGGNWLHIAQQSLMLRMAQYEGHHEFNLMAVVHDSSLQDRQALLENVHAIRQLEEKLGGLAEDWQEMAEAATDVEVILGSQTQLGISEADVANAQISEDLRGQIAQEEDFLGLLHLRQAVIRQQAPLRAVVRDTMAGEERDAEEARHRRHDYTLFVRAWLGALAKSDVLEGLVEE